MSAETGSAYQFAGPKLVGKRILRSKEAMKRLLVMVSLLAMCAISLFAIWPWSSGKQYRMTASGNVPAAAGTVKAKIDKANGNTNLDIKVSHLANPSRLSPPANVYVVWVRPRGGDATRQGAIGLDKNLNGELKVVTTLKDFDLFITAEQSENVTVPSNVEILRTHVSLS
jgi:hypothetical protein